MRGFVPSVVEADSADPTAFSESGRRYEPNASRRAYLRKKGNRRTLDEFGGQASGLRTWDQVREELERRTGERLTRCGVMWVHNAAIRKIRAALEMFEVMV